MRNPDGSREVRWDGGYGAVVRLTSGYDYKNPESIVLFRLIGHTGRVSM